MQNKETVTTNRGDIFNRRERILILSGGVLAIVFGIVGFTSYYRINEIDASFSDILYNTLNLFVFQFNTRQGDVVPWTLEVSRWLAPLSLSYTAIKTLTSFMGERLNHLKISRLRSHAIVCGLNTRTKYTIESFLTNGIPVVVLCFDTNNPLISWVKTRGGHLCFGSYQEPLQLEQCGIQKAKYLLTATAHDHVNIEILHQEWIRRKHQPQELDLLAAVEVRNSALASCLYDHEIFAQDYTGFSARVINYSAMKARYFLQKCGPHKVARDRCSSNESLKILFLGSDGLIDDLILRIATIGHYGTPRTHICLTGTGSKTCKERLLQTNSGITELIDLDANEIDFSLLNIQSSKSFLEKFSPDLIYICASHLESTLVWIQTLKQLDVSIPVICTTHSVTGQTNMIEEMATPANFIFYGQETESSHYETLFGARSDQLAKAIHDWYVQQQLTLNESPDTNSSLVTWDLLPEGLKDSNRNQADSVDIKCSLLMKQDNYSAADVRTQLTSDVIEWLAEIEHARWYAEKLLSGWRHTKSSKNTALRLSPSMVAWDELPEEEKQKDREAIKQLPELVQLQSEVLP